MGSGAKVFYTPRCACRLMRSALVAALVTAVGVAVQGQQPDAGPVIQMLRDHQYPQALDGADRLLKQDPKDCRWLSLKGMAQSGMQMPVEAESSFRQALDLCPDSLLALEGAAQIEYARRKPDAEELLLRILAIRPQDVTTHAMLASFYRSQGKCGAALPQYEASEELFTSRPDFERGYAFCLADTGQYAKAAQAYAAVLSGAPDDAASRFNLALVQWRLHDPKSALETLRPMLPNNSNEMVLALGARVAEGSGDTPLAVKLLRAAIVAQPKNMANYLEFARISFNHRSFQVGIDMIHAGLTELPDAAPLYVVRGVLEMQLAQSSKAIADFEKAHQLEPQLSLAMDAIGIVDSQQYKPKAALDLFREQARLHPRDGFLQYLYAEALSKSAENAETTQQAIEAGQRSIAVDPGFEPARDLMALLWLRANQPERALEQALAALKIQPDDDVALYHEIMARRRLGQTAQVQALAKQLAVLRAQHAQKQRQGQQYILQEGPAS